MDKVFKLKHDNPRKKAGIVSKLLFMWVAPLLRTGTKRLLQLQDLFKVQECNRSKRLGDHLEMIWLDEISKAKTKNRSPSLLRAIARMFLKQYFYNGIPLFILLIFLKSPQPLVLAWLISQFDKGSLHDRASMYASATVLVVISILTIFLQHHSTYGTNCVGMRLRVAISSLINRKVTRLSQKSLGQTEIGQIVNILANDCQRFDMISYFLHYLWIMPFQIVLITYFLWNMFGASCLAGILFMALCSLPVQSYLGKLASTLRSRTAEKTDERVKLMNQIISGIQVIKMYAWEQPFEKLIKMLRIKEVKIITQASYLKGFFLSCMVFIERSTLFLTLLTFTLLGNRMEAAKVFSAAQFFNILQAAMAIMYPMAISIGAETLVAIRRVETFLLRSERDESLVERPEQVELVIQSVTASWVPDCLTLKNIDLVVSPGSLCAIVGPVGAGKSSILQLLLGELAFSSGSVKLGGSISYASQDPWLFAASVRRNILFGQAYNHELYQKVKMVCALDKDFQQLPYGDKSMVGERGVSLSGGQRARINLARAVYREADIYLLDDPLSAVDAHVGKHLFEKCILDFLKRKTRILVTHQLQYLKKADTIAIVNEGRIEAVGTFNDLIKANFEFTKFLASADESSEEQIEVSNNVFSEENDFTETIRVEEQETYSEQTSPLWNYMASVENICTVIMVIVVLILSQASCTCCDLWVTFWTSQEEARSSQEFDIYLLNTSNSVNTYEYIHQPIAPSTFLGIPIENIFDIATINGVQYKFLSRPVTIYVYTGLIMVMILLTVARAYMFFTAAMHASKNIHTNMFHRLLRTPMRFFDINPSGRVLNRFSKDIGAVDEVLPRVLMESIQILLVMSGILVLITISNYYMVIAIVILSTAFLKLRSWYVASARDLKHLEGIAKSPVFSHVNSSLRGLTTIRALKVEDVLIDEFDDHQDVHSSAFFLTITCSEFFGLWLDIVCVLFTGCIAFGFVILADFGETPNDSFVGLALSQALILTGMLQYGMRQTAEVVNQLTSVERLHEYTKLENEGPFDTLEGKMPVLPWPSFGKIEFKNVNLFYVPESGPVLNNLNLQIESKEKIGVVGRTGAGKSSLISAMFRLYHIEGEILIDDLNTKNIGLTDLRRKISIIPQEPVLFSATLRYNLDPFNEFQDDQLWNALDEVELKDVVPTLEYEVAEGGTNFSLGQRQLLCLARALLRNNKILILDEATANVDALTDSLIQKTIRNKFKKCTVITIAHRLNTIMDSDKIIVMDSGRIMEYDHPYRLLQQEESHFTKLAMETGPAMTEQLKSIARNAWQRRRIDDDEDEITRL